MYRKDQVMNMAKAKIVKRKRRLRIEGLATLLLTLKEDVANLEADITKLEDRDRVLGMAEKEGIKTNQDNVVVVDKDEKK